MTVTEQPDSKIVRLFGGAAFAPQTYQLSPERLITGNPHQSVCIEFESPDKQFCVGIWASEPGEWKVNYTEQEYCAILDGVNILTDAEGNSQEFGPGSEFVVPRGFSGTWRVMEATRKRFVIFEQAIQHPVGADVDV
jgi:uncharacterized cupin superfamily protein